MLGQIFISYCHNDGDFAENLALKFKQNGFEVWMDEMSLAGGDEWLEKLDKSIRNSSALVFVMTPESRDSLYATYEWIFALGAGLKVIPVMLKDTELHPRLREIYYHDFTNIGARPWDKLISDLKSICEKKSSDKHNNTPATKEACTIEIPVNCPPIVRKAIMSLDSLTAQDRTNAIELISQCNFSSRDKVLFSAMREHPLNDVRSGIACALGKMKAKVAIPELLEALKDPSKLVRENAASALGEIGNNTAIPGLIEALGDNDIMFRFIAAKALGKIRDNTADNCMPRDVKSAVAEALRKIGYDAMVSGSRAIVMDQIDQDLWIRIMIAAKFGRYPARRR